MFLHRNYWTIIFKRTSLRSALIAGLQGITGSTVPLTYLANLTTDQVALTYELFIEAPYAILKIFIIIIICLKPYFLSIKEQRFLTLS